MTAYSYTKSAENEYTFLSRGPKGIITKWVTFEALGDEVYNVLLESEIDGVRLGDKERSNNADGFRILATVVEIIKHELESNPHRSLYIKGSDNQREMAYQRRALIGEPGLIVFGQPGEEDPFEPLERAKSYVSLLVIKG